jgi:hypothetical protein
MSTRISQFCLFTLLFSFVVGCITRRGDDFLVIPTRGLPPGERIVGFTLTLSNACFASLPSVPVGWSFSLENSPSWQSRLDAQIIVGAAAIEKDDEFFRKPIRVHPSPAATGSRPPRAECRAVFQSTKDFDSDHLHETVITIPLRE